MEEDPLSFSTLFLDYMLKKKKKNILTNIILNFCNVLPIDPPILHTGCLKTTFVQRPTVEINEVLGEQSAKENIIKRQGHTIMKKNPGFIVYCGCSPWSECKRERNWESERARDRERESICRIRANHTAGSNLCPPWLFGLQEQNLAWQWIMAK